MATPQCTPAALNSMPPEILENIIKLSSTLKDSYDIDDEEDRYSHLYNCCLVSKLWCDIAQPLLFRHLDWHSTRMISFLEHNKLPKRALLWSRTLDISSQDRLQYLPLDDLILHCPYVEQIMLEDKILSLKGLLRAAPHLRVLQLYHCELEDDTLLRQSEDPSCPLSTSLEYLELMRVAGAFDVPRKRPTFKLVDFPRLKGLSLSMFGQMNHNFEGGQLQALSLDEWIEGLEEQPFATPPTHLQVDLATPPTRLVQGIGKALPHLEVFQIVLTYGAFSQPLVHVSNPDLTSFDVFKKLESIRAGVQDGSHHAPLNWSRELSTELNMVIPEKIKVEAFAATSGPVEFWSQSTTSPPPFFFQPRV